MSRSTAKGRSPARRRRGHRPRSERRGQGRPLGPGRSRRREAGYTLIGLLVALAVINVALGVAVTSWVTLDRRAREAELLWRGRKYVRALRCHQEETGGLPTELDELVESDCIRRLWADPMTDGGDWELIRRGDVAPEGEGRGEGILPSPRFSPASALGRSATGTAPGEPPGPRTPAAATGPQGSPSGSTGPTAIAEALRAFAAAQAGEGETEGASSTSTGTVAAELVAQLARAQGERADDPETGREPATAQSLLEALQAQRERLTGSLRDRDSGRGDPRSIVGVVSRSGSEGFRTYRGSRFYSDWRFMVQGRAFR